jgi:ATP-dependent DNA helicase RecG
MSSGFIKVDLATLARRESEQVEWKENVADEEAVACTLVAFANDRANLGGGYVVCGVKETRDEHGFPKTEILGLSAADFKRIEKKVLAICRDHVTPSIAPLIEELPTDDPARRVLVFVMPQTGRAHQLRQSNGNTHYWVRVGSNTIQARNGVLLELLTLRGELAPWDRRPCAGSRTADIDLLALRDTLQRIGRLDIPGGVESLLTRDRTIHVLVPPLCAHEPLTDELRPRNFALLLFGREPQRFIPGAYTLFSIYPGTDRSEAHAERHELTGTLIDQARRLIELLDVQSYTAFDKTDQTRPNAVKYPKRALHEAAINALAHRSYEEVHPTRVTVFSDRIEIESPGPLPTGIDRSAWREGKAGAKWRNQALAWLLGRLQLAQGEGQGIPTILRTMHEEGCPPARFDADDSRVLCVLPAHPRHALARTHRAIEEALALGDGDAARAQLTPLLEADPLNVRTLLLFAELQRIVGDPTPVRDFVLKFDPSLPSLPGRVLLALADALPSGDPGDPQKRRLLELAVPATHELRDARRLALELKRLVDPTQALEFIADQLARHPEWREDPGMLQIQGDALIGQAKRCLATARNRKRPPNTRSRALVESQRFLDDAERTLRLAMSLTPTPSLAAQIESNLEFLRQLRDKARGNKS